MTGVVVAAIVSDWTQNALVHILGFGLYASIVALGVAFAYRGATTRSIPAGVAVLVGVSLVAVWLNVEGVLETTIVGDTPIDHYATASYLLGAFVASTLSAEAGRRIGDYLACDVYSITRLRADGETASLVRSGGLVVAIDLPETLDDADGYLPIDDDTRRRLAGLTVRFPHRTTVEDRRDRLETRLERDYDVDYVHLEFADDGTIDALAVGKRPAGLGPTLPPDTAAVAIRGDPAPGASPGESVDVWTTDAGSNCLVASGRLRATAGDVATLVVDAEDADAFAAGDSYRLVTRPTAPTDVSAFVAVLRTADETVRAVTVDADDPLYGEFVGWLPATVLVVDRDGADEPVPFPEDNETIAAGDTVYVLGTPEELRRLSEYERERERERDRERTRESSSRSKPRDRSDRADAELESEASTTT